MTTFELCDSHCHLDDSQFDPDREEVIARARAAGISRMLAIGTGNGPPDLEAAVRLADRHEFIYASVGVHPNDAPKATDATFTDLGMLLRHPKVRAVGEIGLDYHWDVPPAVQHSVFKRQLEIAAQYRMPVIIHTRDAWNDTLSILRENWPGTGLPCVIHCFTGNAEEAAECLALDFYLAFGGITTYSKSAAIREALRLTPANRLLLETDCPYLAPNPHRGRRNEPAYLLDTARVAAEVREESLEELGKSTSENFDRIFAARRTTEVVDKLN